MNADDNRTYTYDARNNIKTVAGKFWYTTSTMHDYVLTNAYDERNRRIFKSLADTTASKESQWFFYYDQWDRLIEAKYTPDISTSSTYSVFYWYYLGDVPVAYYQVDSPGGTTSRRYLHTDETGRPHAAWDWPASGSATRVWEVEAGLMGWDVVTVGATIFQPIRFGGTFYEADTEATTMSGSGARVVKRPGLVMSAGAAVDPFTSGEMSLTAPQDYNVMYDVGSDIADCLLFCGAGGAVCVGAAISCAGGSWSACAVAAATCGACYFYCLEPHGIIDFFTDLFTSESDDPNVPPSICYTNLWLGSESPYGAECASWRERNLNCCEDDQVDLYGYRSPCCDEPEIFTGLCAFLPNPPSTGIGARVTAGMPSTPPPTMPGSFTLGECGEVTIPLVPRPLTIDPGGPLP